VRERAKALFTDAGVVTRKEVLARMRPAITLEGDAEKGVAIFEERCAKCHQLGGAGASLGPNLTEIARKSRETILHDILDPNAAVDSQYVAFTVETADFEVLTGIVEEETQEAVTLRDANNEVITIAKDNIDKMTSGGLSIMPENLEEGLEPQDLANLLEHLLTPR
jgi:putative heme-binding domain-containing protein